MSLSAKEFQRLLIKTVKARENIEKIIASKEFNESATITDKEAMLSAYAWCGRFYLSLFRLGHEIDERARNE